MEKHNLEEYFNRRVSQHSEFIDKDELWDNLGLEKKKKRRGIVWLWSGVALLLISLFVMSQFVWTKSKTVDLVAHENKELVNEKVVSNIRKSDENEMSFSTQNFNKDASNEIKKNDDNLKLSVKSNNEINEVEYKYEKTAKILKPNDNSSISIFNSLGNDNKEKVKTSDSNLTIQTFTKEKIIKDQIDRTGTASANQENSVDEKESPKLPSTDDKLEKETNGKEKNLQLETIVNADIEEEKNDLVKLSENSKDLIFKSDEFDEFEDIKSNESHLLKEEHIEEDPVVLQPKKSPWHLGLYGDGALINRSLTPFNNAVDSLVSIRNASERTLERVGFGTYLKYQSPSGFYAKLGANYTSLNTELKARVLSDSIATTDDFPLTIIVQENGDTLGLNFGTFMERTILDQKFTIYTSHKVIDIPLSIGYQHNVGKWSLFGEVRPSLSIAHSYRGKIYNGQSIVDGNRYVSTATKFSLATAVGVAYNVNDKWNVWMQPYYQTTFNSYMNENTGQSEKYSFSGLRLGAEMRF